MKLVDRYITKNVLGAVAFILLMLTGLQIFILLVNELGDIGKADYGLRQAVVYVLLQVPYQVYLFLPMGSLLGCLIGLGMMANHHELVVMRAAGMSISQITKVVLRAALILVILGTLVGETILPKLAGIAKDYQLRALSKGQTLRTSKGVWLRQQSDFINIGSIVSGDFLEQVFQFKFDDKHHLSIVRKLNELHFEQGKWVARGVEETRINDNETKTYTYETMDWDVPLKPKILELSSNDPEEMTLATLHRYMRIQKKNHQSVFNYQLVFWQRLVQPFTTLVMTLLAIPFIFGPLRSSTIGAKLLTGAMVGFGFYIFNRFFGPICYVLQWPPEIAAIGPTVVFAFLGVFLMRRVR